MSMIDGELFRKKFFALDIEFRPSQIDAVFDCLGDSEIVESSVSCENPCEIERKTNASDDLIRREDLIESLQERYKIYTWDDGGVEKSECASIIREVMRFPSAEPQITRCNDCKWYGGKMNYPHPYKECTKHHCLSAPNDYCSKAERRINERL